VADLGGHASGRRLKPNLPFLQFYRRVLRGSEDVSW